MALILNLVYIVDHAAIFSQLLMGVNFYRIQDFLNDRLQEGFLQRICYAMKPDEAYGLIFSWDNVVVNFELELIF